jgi:hypothetical protein
MLEGEATACSGLSFEPITLAFLEDTLAQIAAGAFR